MAKRDLEGQWALITGASSGFGVDFAHLLAARGAHVVLAARSLEPMHALAAELERAHGVRTQVVGIDLARPGVGAELKARLDAAGIAVDILVNNAGYGVYGDFLDHPLARTLDMIQLNVATLTELTHTFAAPMRERGRGKILLVASIGGYQATPTYAAYSATKAYVLLFGEALHEELKRHGVTVTVLSPGITATRFLQVSGQQATLYQRLVMMQSRPVARIGLDALYSGRASIVPGWLNALTAWSNRLMPRAIQRKMAYLLMKN
ncbi:SDR family oxidoreductase [Massilia arenosa]|uniref:SDR family oxidoreductase n=1 Tax=Zemynaea arenosa TaxID=2561931 RepID=A0A4Y9SG79_9BURK|nr:SDR family oxidoreductase [Massilia arenosa]TFW22911.1 SDR family oxidoreductase [Massilia arenosa]